MSRHTSYRGITIDMDTMRNENEKTTAIGNMKVNARGDQLGKNGTIIKNSDQIARENYNRQTTVVNTGLKGDLPSSPATIEQNIPATTVKPTSKKTKEKELPSGDIIMEDDNEGKS